MSDFDQQNPSRRTFMKRAIYLTSVVAVGASALGSTAASAATISKADAHYQDAPKDGNSCSKCYYFDNGTCKRGVVGPVSSNGYCDYFSPKS